MFLSRRLVFSTPTSIAGTSNGTLERDDISVIPAVPEASTTVSFGLLLALAGVVVAARKRAKA